MNNVQLKKIMFRSDLIGGKRRFFLSRQLLEVEQFITYSYGPKKRFSIQHGNDYFCFFERLGVPYWALIVKGGQVCSQLCAVLRKIPNGKGAFQKAWYLCDLKKNKKVHQNESLKLLFSRIFWLIWKCQRGYAISMNLPDHSNPMDRLIKQAIFLPIRSKKLWIYSLPYDEFLNVLPIIQNHRGAVGYLNLEGKKDLIFEDTKKKMALMHLQYGPLYRNNLKNREFGKEAPQNSQASAVRRKRSLPNGHGASEHENFEKSPTQPETDSSGSLGIKEIDTEKTPLAGFEYMWCSLEKDPLSISLQRSGCTPKASATIYHFRMKKQDWSWILTSDI